MSTDNEYLENRVNSDKLLQFSMNNVEYRIAKSSYADFFFQLHIYLLEKQESVRGTRLKLAIFA